jgi:quercetin dioxygenase-like cupin family protein
MLGELNAAAAPPLADPGPPLHVIASAGDYAVLGIRMAPGEVEATHRHDREDQALLVLEGELTVVLDGRPALLAPGDFAHLPRGVPHRLEAGPRGARLLCVCSPGGYEALAAALADPTLTPDDLAALRAAAGVHLVATRW